MKLSLQSTTYIFIWWYIELILNAILNRRENREINDMLWEYISWVNLHNSYIMTRQRYWCLFLLSLGNLQVYCALCVSYHKEVQYIVQYHQSDQWLYIYCIVLQRRTLFLELLYSSDGPNFPIQCSEFPGRIGNKFHSDILKQRTFLSKA